MSKQSILAMVKMTIKTIISQLEILYNALDRELK